MKIFIASEHFFSTSSLSDHLANVSKIFQLEPWLKFTNVMKN